MAPAFPRRTPLGSSSYISSSVSNGSVSKRTLQPSSAQQHQQLAPSQVPTQVSNRSQQRLQRQTPSIQSQPAPLSRGLFFSHHTTAAPNANANAASAPAAAASLQTPPRVSGNSNSNSNSSSAASAAGSAGRFTDWANSLSNAAASIAVSAAAASVAAAYSRAESLDLVDASELAALRAPWQPGDSQSQLVQQQSVRTRALSSKGSSNSNSSAAAAAAISSFAASSNANSNGAAQMMAAQAAEAAAGSAGSPAALSNYDRQARIQALANSYSSSLNAHKHTMPRASLGFGGSFASPNSLQLPRIGASSFANSSTALASGFSASSPPRSGAAGFGSSQPTFARSQALSPVARKSAL